VILDEADQMLKLGFKEDIEEVRKRYDNSLKSELGKINKVEHKKISYLQ
jgi:superfamily II DNA/RNA helicase